MELDQNNKLDDFVISRYESFIVPNQKFNQTIIYINFERSMKNFIFGNFFLKLSNFGKSDIIDIINCLVEFLIRYYKTLIS